MAHDDAVPEGRPVKQQRADGLQGVEPSPGLVHRLADEIRREVPLELLLVLEGIVPLGEGHAAGIVPAVDHFLHAVHVPAALRAFQLHRVDEGPVQLHVLAGILHRHPAQLRPAADHVHGAAFAFPHGQGRSPVSFAAQAPVDDVLQEVAHPAFLDVVRHPVDGPVVAHQVVPQLGHPDEPGRPRVVQQGRVAPPAEGIVMREGHRREQQSPLLQILQDQGIRVLDEGAGPVRPLDEAALGVHQVDEGHPVLPAHAVVVLAEGRGDVHDAGAVLHRDVVVADHEPGLPVRLPEAVQRLIFLPLQRGARELIQEFDFLPREHLFHQGLRHVIAVPVHADPAVGVRGIDAQRQVARQRPGRRGPGQQVGVLLPLRQEADEGRGLLHVLVSLGHLVAGQGRAAAGAVGHDLVALIQQALLMDLLQAPPFALDVVVVVGDVGMLHVRPVADLVAHLLPLMQVFPDALLAFGDEGLDAVFLDLGLAVQAQALLDLQLHRQAVGIPSGDAQGALPLHGLIPGEQILDDPGLDMPDVGLAVGRGRPVEEGKLGRAVPQVEGFADDVLLLPHLRHFLLPGHKIHIRRDFIVHGGFSFLSLPAPFRPAARAAGALRAGS